MIRRRHDSQSYFSRAGDRNRERDRLPPLVKNLFVFAFLGVIAVGSYWSGSELRHESHLILQPVNSQRVERTPAEAEIFPGVELKQIEDHRFGQITRLNDRDNQIICYSQTNTAFTCVPYPEKRR